MANTLRAFLEGGPADLPERIVSLTAPGDDFKVAFRGGYEHFRITTRRKETEEGQLPVYEWWERTEFPG
ncbi:DUF5988 family protein [Streptomyces sp. PTD5-9]|uniref:DUF5988 family protein n=1 Tax=Streptomyces sp. PTD5-9 TaxID=3120150 RepID=UPI0030084A02